MTKDEHGTPVYPDPYKIIDGCLYCERRTKNGSYDQKLCNRTWDDYVCTDELGTLLYPDYVSDHFSDLLERLGMRHIRFHDLRHTFASVLLRKEVPLINVSNFLGHSTISTTANIYAHLDKSAKQSSADVISNVFRKEQTVAAG